MHDNCCFVMVSGFYMEICEYNENNIETDDTHDMSLTMLSVISLMGVWGGIGVETMSYFNPLRSLFGQASFNPNADATCLSQLLFMSLTG